ncbi:Unknown protein sequence [Pseudomonas syringae pv. aceris]|nr:Unknown protein sequence [Pseudomonas syringae pv. aceris]
MAAPAMLEAEMHAFFLAQALQQVQIAFVVLDMQRPGRIKTVHVLEAVSVRSDTVCFKQAHDQLRNRTVLIGAALSMLRQPLQIRHQNQMVKAHAIPPVQPGRMLDTAMPAAARFAEA